MRNATSGAVARTFLLSIVLAVILLASQYPSVVVAQATPANPILVVVNNSSPNPFGMFIGEILQTEGLNEFQIEELGNVDGIYLSNFDVVILAETPLTSPQVTMLEDYVTAGGNLIAMRPDKELAGLFGLTDASTTLTEGYLLIDTASGPGAGLVGETIQFHGTADQYTLSGAAALATLYTDAATATPYPAVALNSVGVSGGQAAAFTYDLARSVVYSRQGNPAWEGMERDGSAPLRSDDMFYGDAAGDPQLDWIDLSKVAIPQADEQQRLLANLILNLNFDRKPLPRFWYFPRGEKAVVIMTGDDHGVTDVDGRLDRHIALSPAGCSVADWECVRSTAYLYTSSALTDAQALNYHNLGFELALHVTTGCADYTPASLASDYATQLAGFAATWPSIPAPSTERTHCVAWSDWAGQAHVELDNGIRLDTNYYFWPSGWVNNQPGLFTASGMPMRFADLDGTIIDVFQAATQMTDESDQAYPFTADTLLDRALGPQGYYGAFTTNMHLDPGAIHPEAEAIISSALARDVPVVSGQQMLGWLDGRNGSAFSSIAWAGNVLTFDLTVGAGANGLQVMVPTQSAIGSLTGITLDSSPVAYSTETIKGVEYAMLAGSAGTYEAIYQVDTTPPVISDLAAVPHTDGTASITWNTNETADSSVDYGTDLGALIDNVSDASLVTGHSLGLTGLAPQTTYYYRVTSADAASNSATSPPTGESPASFTTPSAAFIDTTVADFVAGTVDTCLYVSETDDGEVMLAPAGGAEFSGTGLPLGWTESVWEVGGSTTVGGGLLTVDGALARAETLFATGRILEFVATFSAVPNQHAGLGGGDETFNGAPWAIFSTGTAGTQLQARTSSGSTFNSTDLGAQWLGAPHRYRIEWNGGSVDFFIDGTLVDSDPITIGESMRIAAGDLHAGGSPLTVDWMRLTPYATPCVFESRVLDAGGPADWGTISWTSAEPAGTGLTMNVRTGDSATPDGTWTTFSTVSNGSSIGGSSRYIQYQSVLTSSDPDRTPVLEDVTIGYIAGPDTTPPTVIARSPAAVAGGVALDTVVSAEFSEAMEEVTIDNSSFRLRVSGAGSDVAATVSYDPGTRIATLTPDAVLGPGTEYQATVDAGVTDVAGNPLGSDDVWSFTTGQAALADTTVGDFEAGIVDACLYVAETADGELMLAPTVGAEFSGVALPAGWSSLPWATGGTATVGGGQLVVDEARAWTDASYGPERVLEFVATFGSAQYHHAGFAVDQDFATPYAMFSTHNTSSALYARTNAGIPVDVSIPGSWLDAPHTYRIEWLPASVDYYIDDSLVHTEPVAIASNMRPVISDFLASGPNLVVDWLRMSLYADVCTFESRVFDAGTASDWSDLSWLGGQPVGTTVGFETRTGGTAVPDGSWSAWVPVNSPIASPNGRYLQYRASLGTSDLQTTPVIEQVTVTYGAVPTAITLASLAANAGAGHIVLSWETATELDSLGFNLYRAESLTGPRTRINEGLIAAQMPGSPMGASYTYVDEGVEVGVSYLYWLEEVEVDGKVTVHGPVEAELNPLRRLLPARPRPLLQAVTLEAR